MDQVKIGKFLKELRKEKGLTQEQLAEKLNVSNRSISRYETGNNMPDISLLIEIADIFEVSIPEIINGERKSENMNQETKETAVAMAKYSKNEVKNEKMKLLGILLLIFSLFIIISALSIFPSESSWGSIYSILGSLVLIIGVYLIVKQEFIKSKNRLLVVLGCIVVLFGAFSLSDYIAASRFNQVPRFSYKIIYDSRIPNVRTFKTIFFTAVQENPGTEKEKVYILK